MEWAAVIEYIHGTTKIGEIRPVHREYLKSLLDTGKLVCAGPFLDDFGSLIVYEADTKEAAEAILQADPFHANGIFVRWTIRPWKPVFANPQLLPPNG